MATVTVLTPVNNSYNHYRCFGWVDITVPATYVTGNGLTVNLTCQAITVGDGAPTAGYNVIGVCGLQFTGTGADGTYTNAPLSATGASNAPGLTYYNYLDAVTGGYWSAGMVTKDITTVRSVLSFSVPGTAYSNPNSFPPPAGEPALYNPAVGGALLIDYLSGGEGYVANQQWEIQAGKYVAVCSFGECSYWPEYANNAAANGASCGSLIGGGHQYLAGEKMSLLLYCFTLGTGNGLTGDFYNAISTISVTDGITTTPIPVTDAQVGFGVGQANDWPAQKTVDSTLPPYGKYYYLRTITEPPTGRVTSYAQIMS